MACTAGFGRLLPVAQACFGVFQLLLSTKAALRKVIETLATGTGDFAESEAWLFSSETLALVDALIDARLQGRYPDMEWQLKL